MVTGNYHYFNASCSIFRKSSEIFINFGITFLAYSKTSAYTISRSPSSKSTKSLDNFWSNCFKVMVAYPPLLLGGARNPSISVHISRLVSPAAFFFCLNRLCLSALVSGFFPIRVAIFCSP